jgi:PAS domain S-box-containing protein
MVHGFMDNDRYRQLVEHSPDGILISRDGRLIFLNPAAARLFGAPAAERLVGTPLVELFEPDSRAELETVLTRLLAGETVAPVEERLRSAEGSSTIVELTGTRIAPQAGEALPLVALTVRNITERKVTESALRESEERLTLAFAGAQEGVWDWNLETGAVVYSPRWKKMLGYADDEIEPHVSAWERLLHPDDRPRANEVFDSVSRGDRMYEGEFRLRHKAGHYTPVLSRGFPVRREPGGPVVRIVGTHFDLTERKQAEAERARTELLERLVFAQEDERRRIAREMHDQFGEQLTALTRGIGALKEACAGDAALTEQVDTLGTIAQQLDRDVDHLVWELRPTALDDLGLRAALANYVQDWSKRVKISAELHSSGLLDDRLPSDAETTLYRIAQEALTNVAKHSQARSVDVILERHADAVVLIVEDDGIGFDAGETERSDRGFGLMGMHERAGLVGAVLQIESTPGAGTTVLVRLATSQPGSSTHHA